MTAIEWTDATWNPTIGCTRVSAGCVNCYAEQAAAGNVRRGRGASPYGPTVRTVGGQPRWTGVVTRNSDARFYRLRTLTPGRKPQRVFVNSMSDVFHEQAIEKGLTARIYYEMRKAPGRVYQLLTKRPELAAEFYAAHSEVHHLPGIWLGSSVEDAAVKHRIDTLRGIPASLRFLSIEPLIGAVGRIDLTAIGWVIVGGESGRGARPMQADWLREVRDQCVAASVPFFFKQWGGPASAKRGHEEAVIDGREWKEFPAGS